MPTDPVGKTPNFAGRYLNSVTGVIDRWPVGASLALVASLAIGVIVGFTILGAMKPVQYRDSQAVVDRSEVEPTSVSGDPATESGVLARIGKLGTQQSVASEPPAGPTASTSDIPAPSSIAPLTTETTAPSTSTTSTSEPTSSAARPTTTPQPSTTQPSSSATRPATTEATTTEPTTTRPTSSAAKPATTEATTTEPTTTQPETTEPTSTEPETTEATTGAGSSTSTETESS